jgi:hypothetical protein
MKKTHLVLILDASGSINRKGGSIKSAVVSSVNKLIAEQRKLSEDCTVQLFQFNSSVRADEVKSLRDFHFSSSDYNTKGNTHLFDAVCEAFDRTGQYLAALPEDQRPQKVVVAIITDGLERGSQRFNRQAVVARVRHQTEAYNWQVCLLIGNYNASDEAAQLGIDPENAIRFTVSDGGVEAAMAKLSTQTGNYRAGRANSLALAGQDARINLANVVAS